MEFASSLDALNTIKLADACVVMSHVAAQDQLIKLITLLKLIQEPVAERRCRVIVTDYLDTDILEERLKRYGCSEVIHEPVNEKSLAFKLDRYVRAVES